MAQTAVACRPSRRDRARKNAPDPAATGVEGQNQSIPSEEKI